MVCPHEIYVLQVLSGRGVAALNAGYIVSACSNRFALNATPASNLPAQSASVRYELTRLVCWSKCLIMQYG